MGVSHRKTGDSIHIFCFLIIGQSKAEKSGYKKGKPYFIVGESLKVVQPGRPSDPGPGWAGTAAHKVKGAGARCVLTAQAGGRSRCKAAGEPGRLRAERVPRTRNGTIPAPLTGSGPGDGTRVL